MTNPQDNERLNKEVKELHETIFSKSFKAPSAWAEREVKYKMEKRAWEAQVEIYHLVLTDLCLIVVI